jgi:hypothetical protein
MSEPPITCRLCDTPLQGHERGRNLCAVCDEYAQHVALHSNKELERIVGDLQNGPIFRNASRNRH